nr:TOBE domain-containing protein [Acuticoccus kalidii]
MLRPEHLRITDAAREAIGGTIRRASYLGAQCEYRVETSLGPLLLIEQGAQRLRSEGESIAITIDPHHARIIERERDG